MILIAYPIWIWLSFVAGRRMAKRFGQGRISSLVIGWTVIPVLILIPHWDVVLGIPVMISKCKNEAGVRVNKDVSFPLSSLAVDGDGCMYCNELLVKGMALEVQGSITGNYKGDLPSWVVAERPGPIRYWLAPKNDPACKSFYRVYETEDERREIWEKRGLPYNDTICIASESIPAITADYVVTASSKKLREWSFVWIRLTQIRLYKAGSKVDSATFKYFRQILWSRKLGIDSVPLSPVIPQCPDLSNERDGVSGNGIPLVFLFEKLTATKRLTP